MKPQIGVLPKNRRTLIEARIESWGDIRALEQLRNQGLISLDNLIVIGLYHEKQLTNFDHSIRYAKENGRDWVKFHELRGDLEPEKLFQKNALSDELLKIFSYSDGLILFGGDDIPPFVYREKTSLLTNIATPLRSYLDIMVVFHLLGGFVHHPDTDARLDFLVRNQYLLVDQGKGDLLDVKWIAAGLIKYQLFQFIGKVQAGQHALDHLRGLFQA